MNYHNILTNDAKETVSWDVIEKFARFPKGITCLAPQQKYYEGYPRMLWAEYCRSNSIKVCNFFDSFDKMFYLHRHPGDVMISMFFYFVKPETQKMLKIFDLTTSEYFQEYVKHNIPNYLAHIEQTIDYADFVLCYDVLRNDPSDFRKVVKLFYDGVDEEVFKKALEFSSFKSVNNILTEEWIKERGTVRHTRDGRSGQYKERMNKELIEWIKEKTKERGLYKLWKW